MPVRLLEKAREVGGVAVPDGLSCRLDGFGGAILQKHGGPLQADSPDKRSGRKPCLCLQAPLQLAGAQVHLVGEPIHPEVTAFDVLLDHCPGLPCELLFLCRRGLFCFRRGD